MTVVAPPPVTGVLYAGSTGRLNRSVEIILRPMPNGGASPSPITYPYAGPSSQALNASTRSIGSSHQGGGGWGSKQQPAPLSYPPARPGSSLNGSLV